MNIGIPKERRPFEFRVGLTPTAVHMLTQHMHKCYVEHEAGLGAGFSDQEFEQAGARIVYSPHEVFGRADLLVKVARPLLEEIRWLRPGTAIAGLLHLNSARQDKIDASIGKRDLCDRPGENPAPRWLCPYPTTAGTNRRFDGVPDSGAVAAE